MFYKAYRIFWKWLFEKEFSKNFITILCQLVLLGFAAMVLEREDHWVVRCNKSRISNRVNDILSNTKEANWLGKWHSFLDKYPVR